LRSVSEHSRALSPALEPAGSIPANGSVWPRTRSSFVQTSGNTLNCQLDSSDIRASSRDRRAGELFLERRSNLLFRGAGALHNRRTRGLRLDRHQIAKSARSVVATLRILDHSYGLWGRCSSTSSVLSPPSADYSIDSGASGGAAIIEVLIEKAY
jgi:hypothetical protein